MCLCLVTGRSQARTVLNRTCLTVLANFIELPVGLEVAGLQEQLLERHGRNRDCDMENEGPSQGATVCGGLIQYRKGPFQKRHGKMHQPGIEPGSHRWQRCILPLDH